MNAAVNPTADEPEAIEGENEIIIAEKVSYFAAHLDQCFDPGKSFDDGDIREVVEFRLGERSEDVILRHFFDCLVYECYRDSYAAVFGR